MIHLVIFSQESVSSEIPELSRAHTAYRPEHTPLPTAVILSVATEGSEVEGPAVAFKLSSCLFQVVILNVVKDLLLSLLF